MPNECVIRVEGDEAIVVSASLRALLSLVYHPNIFCDSFYPQLILTFHNIGMKTTEAQEHVRAFLDNYVRKMYIEGLSVPPDKVIKCTVKLIEVWNRDFAHDFFDDSDANEIRERMHQIFALLTKLDLGWEYADEISSVAQMIDTYFYDTDVKIAKKDDRVTEPKFKHLNLNADAPFPMRAPPEDIVNHFTYIELQQFASIERIELLQCAWTKPDKDVKAPHIVELTKHFNDTSLFVISTILAQKKYPRNRGNVIEAWIKVMDAAYAAKNFSLLFEISGGLSNPGITRLDGSWRYVSPNMSKRYKELCLYTHPHMKFKNYRMKLKSDDVNVGVTLPYVGLWLNSMSLVDNENQTFVNLPNGEKGINFQKQMLIYKDLVNVLKKWGEKITFNLDKSLLKEIREMKPMYEDQNEIFKVSKDCELILANGEMFIRKEKNDTDKKKKTSTTPKSDEKKRMSTMIYDEDKYKIKSSIQKAEKKKPEGTPTPNDDCCIQ